MKYKIFGSGVIRGVDYTKDKLKELFSVEKSDAIFAHTSNYDSSTDIPKLGEFKEFEVRDDGVYADLQLNDRGLKVKSAELVKGISVELDKVTGMLKRVALLPVYDVPAIKGAEFAEKEFILEFKQEEKEMDEKKIREDERKKVLAEKEAEFAKTKEELIEEFEAKKTIMTNEFKAKMEEIKKEAVATAKFENKVEEFKALANKKFDAETVKPYLMLLEFAKDENADVFEMISNAKGLDLKDVDFSKASKEFSKKKEKFDELDAVNDFASIFGL